ncbi:hypothetical protein M436DRAFT_72676 [Aureobasidium namibiae CBS 147.97]|uniref:Tat pathway signal sequence n=1 Tax=Aureobasidium namibiae CBS 147.97 TaxID=1043004 RepID=A0A074WP37_9PEZI
MSLLNIFGRRNEASPTYNPVSDDEDKSLYEPTQATKAELESLKQANTNLKRVLAVVAAFFLAFLAIIAVKSWESHKDSLLFPRILGSPVPPMPMNVQTFERNPLYANRPSSETDAAWNALLPEGRGFVYVSDSQRYSLPPGEQTFYGEIYSVSLFHQLHCLGQLRKYYWLLVDGVMSNSTSLRPVVEGLLGPSGEHVSHCFDYLRQTLQCAGDMALEWPRKEEDGSRFAVDGWGIPHECRSWDHIVDYMKGSYFNLSSNNDIAPDHPMHKDGMARV